MSPTPSHPDNTKLPPVEWSSSAHLQTKWDWRAVGNFIGGGTGAGLLLAATLLAPSLQAYRLQAGLGLAIIALGLLCIMAKMGRPTRAFNVFRQVETSWMTREGLAMPTLFGCGALSIWPMGQVAMAVAATLSALFFLYCQARILGAAKGIPAWSEPRIVPFILATGIAEGTGLATFCAAFVPGNVSIGLAGLLLGLLAVRGIAWHRYEHRVRTAGGPIEAVAVLEDFGGNFRVSGHGLPGALLVTGMVLGDPAITGLTATAGLIVAATGWYSKYTIVTRAAFFHRKSISLSALLAQGRPQS